MELMGYVVLEVHDVSDTVSIHNASSMWTFRLLGLIIITNIFVYKFVYVCVNVYLGSSAFLSTC